MMRLDYFAWVSPCGDGVKKALGTPLTKLGYAIADAKDGWISGRRGDVGLAAGPSEVPDIYCELLLATPYIDAALDPGQFPDSFENELNGGPTIEYPPPTAAVL